MGSQVLQISTFGKSPHDQPTGMYNDFSDDLFLASSTFPIQNSSKRPTDVKYRIIPDRTPLRFCPSTIFEFRPETQKLHPDSLSAFDGVIRTVSQCNILE